MKTALEGIYEVFIHPSPQNLTLCVYICVCVRVFKVDFPVFPPPPHNASGGTIAGDTLLSNTVFPFGTFSVLPIHKGCPLTHSVACVAVWCRGERREYCSSGFVGIPGYFHALYCTIWSFFVFLLSTRDKNALSVFEYNISRVLLNKLQWKNNTNESGEWKKK